VASFAGSPKNGAAPLTVSFTNLSNSATSYSWDFGNGNTSTAANPSNTYMNAGSYSVKLTAINATGTDTLTRTNYIVVSTPPPVANFTAGATNGVVPLAVTFTNLSTGATNYSWDFGDGKTSSATDAANTYTNAGGYTVKLVAVGARADGQIAVTNGRALLNVTNLGVGAHAVRAEYNSDYRCAFSSGAVRGVRGRVTSAFILGDGSFQIGFTNAAGAPFSVLATPVISLPLTQWQVLGPAIEILPGQFKFTDSQSSNLSTSFYYRLRSP
jgi:hypothetical protein